MCETCGCGHDHHHIHLIIPVKGVNNKESSKKIEAILNELSGVHATVDYKLGAISLLLHEDGDLAKVKKIINDQGFKA